MTTRVYQFLAICALCLAAAALAVTLWTSVLAQEEAPQSALAIPTTINYMGYLREPDGSLTTGTHDITAKIYDLATGGNAVYTTTLTGVTVRDGLFNIVLGDDPPMPSSVFANAPLYIGISLNTDAELVPRQRLHAVPWAFQASTLINNATAQTVQGLTSNGDVTVNGATALNGNATVTGNLTVTGSLARSPETFVGPHFLGSAEEIKPYGPCPAKDWADFHSAQIPDGATAVILEYLAIDNTTQNTTLGIRKQAGSGEYILAYVRAWGGGDDVGWGGQGIFPIQDNGTFQWNVNGGIQICMIRLIGYYK